MSRPEDVLGEALETLHRLRVKQWDGFEEQMPPQVLAETAGCERAALTALTDELAAKDARLKEVEAELNFVLELHGAAEAFKRVEAVLANALTASPPEQETEEDS